MHRIVIGAHSHKRTRDWHIRWEEEFSRYVWALHAAASSLSLSLWHAFEFVAVLTQQAHVGVRILHNFYFVVVEIVKKWLNWNRLIMMMVISNTLTRIKTVSAKQKSREIFT